MTPSDDNSDDEEVVDVVIYDMHDRLKADADDAAEPAAIWWCLRFFFGITYFVEVPSDEVTVSLLDAIVECDAMMWLVV